MAQLMNLLQNTFFCCLGSDKMNRPTLTFKFEASFALQLFNIWPRLNGVRRTCDVRWGVILHLFLADIYSSPKPQAR